MLSPFRRLSSAGRARAVFFWLGAAVFATLLLDRLGSLIGSFSSLLLICFLAWLLAFVMSPLVILLDQRARLPHGLSVAMAYLLVGTSVAGLIFAAGSVGVGEAAEMIEREPEASARLSETLRSIQSALNLDRSFIDLPALYRQAHDAVIPQLGDILSSQLRNIAETSAAILGSLFIILILSIYLLVDSASIVAAINRLAPDRYASQMRLIELSVARAFSAFLRAQLALVALQFVLTAGLGLLFGLPFLFVVSLIAALAMFIPFFGPPLALLPPLLVSAIFAPNIFLPLTLLLVGIQSVLVNYLQPRLMQRSVGMHPILVILTLLVGAQLAGLWGAIFGIPLVAALSILLRYLFEQTSSEDDEAAAEAGENSPPPEPPGLLQKLRRALRLP